MKTSTLMLVSLCVTIVGFACLATSAPPAATVTTTMPSKSVRPKEVGNVKPMPDLPNAKNESTSTMSSSEEDKDGDDADDSDEDDDKKKKEDNVPTRGRRCGRGGGRSSTTAATTTRLPA